MIYHILPQGWDLMLVEDHESWMPLVPLLALVMKKSKYKIKPTTTKYLCKKVGKENVCSQFMETLRKYLCKYVNM